MTKKLPDGFTDARVEQFQLAQQIMDAIPDNTSPKIIVRVLLDLLDYFLEKYWRI